MTTRPFAALVRKDLRLFLSDRRAVILSFVAPLMLASLFSMLGGGEHEGGSRIAHIAIKTEMPPSPRRAFVHLRYSVFVCSASLYASS